MRIYFLVLVHLVLLSTALGQSSKYWIFFDTKDTTPSNKPYVSERTLTQRKLYGYALNQETDKPISVRYLEAIKALGLHPICQSKWLNGVSAELTLADLEQIKKLSFVRAIEPIDSKVYLMASTLAVDPELIHIALKQMQANVFVDDSLFGKGVSIGVIDAGFFEAHTDKKLKHLFDQQKILGQKDFLDSSRKDIIHEKVTDADSHGRSVLSMIAGYNFSTKELTGLAIQSDFYLARTEDGNREYRGEEDTWIAAVEWLDSLGVRLISTSLGYAIKMDNPEENYKKEDMNGTTTRISQAAQIAFEEKGIFLVVSAGNEGSNIAWQIISSPADAKGALSIGATKSDSYEKMEYSSIGPEHLPYLKPNVSCYSRSGTSFSAPAIAGFVACLMQKAPQLSNKQLKTIIEKSAHLYPYGNNYIGYGIPKASRAIKLIADSTAKFPTVSELVVRRNRTTLKSNTYKRNVTLFHKKNSYFVYEQTTANFIKGKLVIRRPLKEIERTTVTYLDYVVEIIWK